MQYLKSNDKVPEEVDRMHIRDNLKAVQVSKHPSLHLTLTLPLSLPPSLPPPPLDTLQEKN